MKKRNLFWSGWIIERGRWRHALSKEQTTEKESVCVLIFVCKMAGFGLAVMATVAGFLAFYFGAALTSKIKNLLMKSVAKLEEERPRWTPRSH